MGLLLTTQQAPLPEPTVTLVNLQSGVKNTFTGTENTQAALRQTPPCL